MELSGANLVAGVERRSGGDAYRSVDPSTGEEFGPPFVDATEAEVAEAVEAATEAFDVLRRADRDVLVGLLRGAAERLEGLGEQLVETAARETGLGAQRITGERARTCAQLRLFADVVADGAHLDVRIDTPDPDAVPPRPALRRMQVPLGPVAVYGASNFPLAFSVPGGDTASALAAGCPVVAKAHPSHPATSELAARAITDAVADAGLPPGTFSLLHGRAVAISQALVLHPGVKAVGFTGSIPGGRALHDLASSRPEPIPVYAEMGSLNPQLVTEGALAERSEDLARGLVTSMTMGTGQFCTKPGIVCLPDSAAGRAFEAQVADAAGGVAPTPLLNAGIARSLQERLTATTSAEGVEVLAAGAAGGPGFLAAPTVVAADAATVLGTPALLEEHFGPVTVLVRCADPEQMAEVVRALPGALAASLHATEADAEVAATLLDVLREAAGRVLWNGFPTGVAVSHAQHHGGPYPASTWPAHTSVGSAAIRRFLRPVTYQEVPDGLLPPALRDANPLGLLRLLDGRLSDAAL
jgi:acyl-CoA reductase-like NAD-dependent aldehyde dehydrogenase